MNRRQNFGVRIRQFRQRPQVAHELNTHTHIRLTALFPGLPWVSRYQKGKNQSGFY